MISKNSKGFLVYRFAEIRGFVEKGELEGHVESTKTAARKLLKSLMHSVKVYLWYMGFW